MPSATSRDFYASGLGIPADGYSLNDLKYKYYNNVSRLPINSGSLADNMIDFLLMKLGLPYGSNLSLDDLLSLYFVTLGIQTEEQYENGVLTTRLNECLNPSVEANLNVWTGASGSVNTRVNTDAHQGSWSIQNVTPGSVLSEGPGIIGANIPGLPSTNYCLSMWIKAPAASTHNLFLRSENGVGGNTDLSKAVTASGAWQREFCTGVSRADTAWLSGSFRTALTPQALTMFVDEVLLEKGSVMGTYFDGNSPGARWLGTVNNSASQLTTWSA